MKNKKLSDLLLLSDVDGTLVEAPNPIPSRNIEALKRFTGEGGHFALATGRSVSSARQYVSKLPINAPCVIFNGCGIYDYSNDKLLYARYLPPTYGRYMREIIAHFPQVGAILLNQTDMYSVSEMEYVKLYLSIEKMKFIPEMLENIQGDFFKAIFAMPPELVPQLQAFTMRRAWPDVEFVRSSPFYYEMLPSGITKGSGILQYPSILNVPIENIVAIGDYYNDETMLKVAGFPVTVSQAPDEIKLLCKFVTGNCADGALADLVEYLEKNCR